MLVTDTEVGLEHFAGLPIDAAVILFRAIEVAYAQTAPATGRGQAEADGAGVVVHVRRGDPKQTVTVALAEGRLTGPDLRVRVTATDHAAASDPPDCVPKTWSVA